MTLSWKQHISNRNLRIKNYSIRYVYPEIIKIFLRVLLLKPSGLSVMFCGGDLCYNLRVSDVHYLKSTELLNECQDRCTFMPYKKKLFLDIFLLLAPIILIKKWLLYINVKEIYVNTDYVLTNWRLIRAANLLNLTTTCIQHGLIPADNNSDIDGLSCNRHILYSEIEKQKLLRAQFLGEIFIFEKKFNIDVSNLKKGCSIFIGPGFSHLPDAEQYLFEILSMIKNELDYYRPHPRCSQTLIKRIESLGIEINADEKSDFICNELRTFWGVKSTMMLDAQAVGHRVVQIKDERLPQYFFGSEIHEIWKYDAEKKCFL